MTLHLRPLHFFLSRAAALDGLILQPLPATVPFVFRLKQVTALFVAACVSHRRCLIAANAQPQTEVGRCGLTVGWGVAWDSDSQADSQR